MPLSSVDVQQILGESTEARLVREKRLSKSKGAVVHDLREAALGRRTFEILRAIEGSETPKKKFSDGDLLALKVIWDLANHSHHTLDVFEKTQCDFSELFELCNTVSEDAELMDWVIIRNDSTGEVILCLANSTRSPEEKVKNAELRIRGLQIKRDEHLLTIKASEASLSGYSELSNKEKIEIELQINQLERSIFDLQTQIKNWSDVESQKTNEQLLVLPGYSGFKLKNSIKNALKRRRRLKNTHLNKNSNHRISKPTSEGKS